MSEIHDESIWLDGEERRAWFALVSVMMRLPHALDAQVRRDANLTHFEFSVLTVLSNSPDHKMKMSTLAATVDGSSPACRKSSPALRNAIGCAAYQMSMMAAPLTRN
ncbi:MAG: hypothetical protein R2709_01155 [Marmoricola sp.]